MIRADLVDEIVAHARRDHPDEACGVVAGPEGSDRPERFIPMLNAARSLGALPEVVTFCYEAVRCAPDDVEARMELAEAYSWSGRTVEFEREWEAVMSWGSSASKAICGRARPPRPSA